MYMQVDFDDDILYQYKVHRYDNFPPLSRSFMKPGTYDVWFDVFNGLTMESFNIELFMVEPINSTSVSMNYSVVYTLNRLDIEVIGGSDVTVFVDWDDGDVSEIFVYNGSDIGSSNETSLAHVYSVPGKWNVTVRISNPLSYKTYHLEIGSDFMIQDLQLDYNEKGNKSVNFIGRTLSNGSQMHCEMNYGDGHILTSYEHTPNLTHFDLSHNYTELGDYYISYHCWNFVDSVTLEGAIFLNTAIENIITNIINGSLLVLRDEDFDVFFNFSDGFPVYFNASIPTLNYTLNETYVDYDLNEGNATFLNALLLPGDHELKLRMNNALSNFIFIYLITFDRCMQNVSITPRGRINDTYIASRTDFVLEYNQDEGSRMKFIWSYGDDNLRSYTYDNLMGGMHALNHTYQYTKEGAFKVEGLIYNSVCMENYTYDVIVEHSLVNVTVEQVYPNLTDHSAAVRFLQIGPGYPPTDVNVFVDFGDGSETTEWMDIPPPNETTYNPRYWDIPHVFPTTEKYNVSIHAFNNVSSLETILEFDMAIPLNNCASVVPITCVKDEDCNIELTMERGSPVTIEYSWGDGTMDNIVFYKNGTKFALQTHVYNINGNYNFTMKAFNSKSTCETTKEIITDVPITNYTMEVSPAELGQPNWVNISALTGSRVTLFLDWGEPNCTAVDQYYASVSDIPPMDYIFAELGLYLCNLSLCNSFGCISDTFVIAVNLPLDDLVITFPEYENISEVASFTRTMTGGSHATCTYDYGDDSAGILQQTDPDLLYVFQHVFIMEGVYETCFRCMNYLTTYEACSNVTVLVPVTGYEPWTYWSAVLTGAPLVFNNNITNGSDVIAEVTYGGLPVRNMTWDGRFLMWTMEAQEHLVGPHIVNVTLTNPVSQVINVFMFTPDYRIVNASVPAISYSSTATPGRILLEGYAGSSIRVDVNWGDGSNFSNYFTENRQNKPWNLTIEHQYTMIGSHVLKVNVSNVHDVYTIEGEMIVEHPVLDTNVIALDNFTLVDNFTFGIRLIMDPPPTDAILDLLFDNGLPNITEPFTATTTCDQLFVLHLSTLDYFNVTFYIYNNVSSVTILHTIRPEAQLVGLEAIISGPQPLGSNHVVNVSFVYGSRAQLSVDFGDDSSVETHTIYSPDEVPFVSHTYASVGTYFVNINVTNTFTFEHFEHLADVDVGISNCSIVVELPLVDSKVIEERPYLFDAVSGTRIGTLYYDETGFAFFQWSPDETSMVAFSRNSTETDVDNATANCFNTLDIGPAPFLEQRLIVNPKITPLIPCVIHHQEMIQFNASADHGTLVYIQIEYGNGDSSTQYFKDGFPSGPVTLDPYQYEIDGTYNWTATIWNHLNSITFNGTICSEIIIGGLWAPDNFSIVLPRTDDLRIDFNWENGTNEIVQVWFDSQELTPDVNFTSRSGYVIVPASLFQIGSSLFKINVSNHISFSTFLVQVDQDSTIVGLSIGANPFYIPVGNDSNIFASVENGSRLIYDVIFPPELGPSSTKDFSDSISKVSLSINTGLVNESGYYLVNVTVRNTVSSLSLILQVGVEYPVIKDNLAFHHTNQVERPSVPAEFFVDLIAVIPPTSAMISYNFSDGSSDNDLILDFSQTNHSQEHNFPEYGDVEAIIWIRNNISSYIHEFKVRVGVEIKEVSLYAEKPHVLVEREQARFWVHVNNGSLVNYNVTFGDGNSAQTSRIDNGWYNHDDTLIQHTYATPGVYIVTVTAYNMFGAVSQDLAYAMKLQYGIFQTEILNLPTHAMPPGYIDFKIQIRDSTPPPTNASCDFDYGDGNVREQVPMLFIGNLFTAPYRYDNNSISPGGRNVLVNCSNLVSNHSYELGIMLHEPISTIFGPEEEVYLKRNVGVGEFITYITSGSHINYTVNFTDGSDLVTRFLIVAPKHLFSQTFSHTYLHAGNYSVEAFLENDVSNQSFTIAKRFVVQNPVPPIWVITNSPVKFGTPASTQVMQSTSPSWQPTNAYCTYKYNQGSYYEYSYAASYPLQLPFKHFHRYRYGDLAARIQKGSVNCSNMISFEYLPFEIILEEQISGLDISYNSLIRRQFMDRFQIFVKVKTGTAVNTYIELGDGTKEVIRYTPSTIRAASAAIVFTKVRFYIHGTFTIKIKLNNTVSSLPADPLRPEKVIVQAVVLPFFVENTLVAPVPPGTVNFSIMVNSVYFKNLVGTDPYVKYECGGSPVWTTYAAALGQNPPQVHHEKHQFGRDMVGRHSCKVTVYNLVSEKSSSTEIYLEAKIDNIEIKMLSDKFIKVGEIASFSVKLGNGSHAYFVIDYKNEDEGKDEVDWEIIHHPNAFDSTSILKFDKQFDQSGNFSVMVMAANNVSNVTVVGDHLQGVQQVLSQLIVTAPKHIAIPGDATQFNIAPPSNSPGPDSVHLTFDFGDGQIKNYFTEAFKNGASLNVSYRYSRPVAGNITIKMKARNEVSNIQSAVTTHVLHKVQGLSIDITDVNVSVSENTTICLNIVEGTEITYLLDFGDQHTMVQEQNCFRHQYKEVGNYSINATASNLVSKEQLLLQKVITVQNPIIRENLLVRFKNDHEFIANPPGELTLVLEISKGEVPSNLHINVDFGDGNTKESYAEALPHEIPYSYGTSEKGLKDITLSLSNLVSSESFSMKASIIKPISGLGIESEEYAATLQKVNFTVTYESGSFVNCTLNYGDGNSYNKTLIDESQYKVHHAYKSPGIYILDFMCWNEISKIAGHRTVIIQNPAANLDLVNPRFQATGQQCAIVVKMQVGAPIPTNASITLYFGDGDKETREVMVTNNETFHHTYTAAGIYYPEFVAENEVSSLKSNGTLIVQEGIEGLRIVPNLLGTADVSYSFPPGSLVELKGDYVKGTDVQFEWMIGGTMVMGSPTTYHFDQTLNIKLRGFNNVSSVMVNRTLTIVSTVRIGFVEYLPSSKIGKKKEFIVSLEGEYGNEICFAYLFKLGNFERAEWCGTSADVCKNDTRFIKDYQKLQLETDSVYSCSFKFYEEGVYNLTIIAFNADVNVIKALNFSISENPCSPALIDPRRRDCLSYRKAKDTLFLSSFFEIVLRCEATKEYNSSFVIEKIENNGTVTEMNVKNGIESPLGTSFLLKKNTLDYGRYFARYALFHPGFNARNESRLCFHLTASPLTTCLNGKKAETVGYGRTIVISTRTNNCTQDPDEGPGKFSFSYYCWSQEYPPEDMDDIGNQTDRIPEGIPEEMQPTNWTGCFSDVGPAKLDVIQSADEIVFDTSWLTIGRTYIFKVVVYKDVRMVTAEYALTIVENDPPNIGIRCDKRTENCQRNGLKINQDKPFGMKIWCSSCELDQFPSYGISIVRGQKEIPVNETTNEQVIEGVKYLFINVDISLLCPGSYDILISAELETKGSSTFGIGINRKPYSCGIEISPKKIKPLQRISIDMHSCEDDGDDVGEAGCDESNSEENRDTKRRKRREVAEKPNDPYLSFEFHYVINGDTYPIFTTNPVLPGGDPTDDYLIEIVATVTDSYGAKSTFSDFIESKAPSYSTPGEAKKALAEMEETIDRIENTDLETSVDILGDLSNMVVALNVITDPNSLINGGTGNGFLPASKQILDEEDELAVDLAKQARLAKMISSIAALSGNELDEATMKASFETFAAFMKKLSPWAPVPIKQQSLSMILDYLNRIGVGHYSADFLSDYFKTFADVLDSSLAIIGLTPLDLEKIAPEKEDKTDIEIQRKENAAMEEQMRRQAANNLVKASHIITDVLRSDMLLEESIYVGNKELSLTLEYSRNIDGKELSTGGSKVKFPEVSGQAGNDSKHYAVFFQVTYTKHNIFSWDKSAKEINKGVTMITLTDQDGNPVEFDDLKSPLKIDMPQKEAADNWVKNISNSSLDIETNMVYMHVPVDVGASAFVMEINRDDFDTDIYFEVYFKFGARNIILDRPNTTLGTYDLKKNIPDSENPSKWILIVPEKFISPPGLFLGVLPKVRNSSIPVNATPQFNVRVSLPRCRSWDMEEEIWTGKTCKVGKDSNMINTRCECNTLTQRVRSYSGGVSLPTVNAIDFAEVFANFSTKLAENPVVLVTIIVILIIYILMLIWARRSDKKDVEKWGVMALLDNPLDYEHLYKVSVYTGLRQNAGTRSRSCFILSGEHGDTGVRVLDGGRSKHLDRGTVRHFLMASERSLGELSFLRVWHDNSGIGIKASWFLDKIVIDDLQAKMRYFFLCGKWLAVDEEDGQIDRILPTAAREEIDGFNHVFFSNARHNLTDEHLWISVISRPTRSHFTRAQRLTCCLTLLCTTMLANAMWYGSVERVEGDQVIKIGPIILSLATLLVSLYSTLTVLPINLIVVQLFRKSKPRFMVELPDGTKVTRAPLKGKRITNMLKYKANDPFAAKLKAHQNLKSNEDAEMKIEDLEDESREEKGRQRAEIQTQIVHSDSSRIAKKKKKKFWFPWWGVPLAWVLALLSIAISLFFVLLYSIEWGRIKSEEWLGALFLAFFQSVMVIQPIKIIVVAMAISIIFRKHRDDEDLNDPQNAQAGADEILEDQDEIENMDRKMKLHIPSAPSRRKLEAARRERQYEKKMWAIVQEVSSYLFFLILVAFIAWGARDDARSLHTTHVKNLMEGDYKWSGVAKVTSWEKFWFYVEDTVVGTVYNVWDYRHLLTKRGDRIYMNDMVNARLGYLRLRQLRIKPALCKPPNIMRTFVMECNTDYEMFNEEKGNFTFGWLPLTENSSKPKDEVEDAFRYKSIFELKGLPVWGKMATFGGGGYVAELGASPKKSLRLLKQLKDVFWVDYYTRGVILEYTLYNVNSNLFAHVTYLFEFPPTGGILPRPMVRSFAVYHVLGGMGTVVLVAEVLYIFILLYFIIREVLKVRKLTWKVYIKDPWNIFEVVVIVTSIVGVAMFGLLETFGRIVTAQLHTDKDAYTHYQQLSAYEETLNLVIGIIVFLTNLRFLRLLRFNRAVADLIHTAKLAVKEILYFGVTFLIMFSAFVVAAFFIFGKRLYLFSDFFRSFSGTFSIMLGKIRWYDMADTSPFLAGIYFFLFLVVMFFILVNMFVSILTAAYDAARKGEAIGDAKYNVLEFLGGKIAGFFGWKKVKKELGEGYRDIYDTLDDRIDQLNDVINNYYREDVRESKKAEVKGDESNSKDVMGSKGGQKASGSDMPKGNFSWTDMFTF